jgi:NAD+ synthase (glutamine-hydrolysing)
MRKLRIALAQLNPTVGDLPGNAAKIVQWIEKARAAGANLVAFPELALCGYPPEDLVFKPSFLRDNTRYLQEIVRGSRGITAVVGFVDANDDAYNAAAVIHNGALVGVYHKMYLPTYSVFDEDRYFRKGDSCPVFVINGISLGVNICEDIWYATGPTLLQVEAGAEVIVNINGSPYYRGKRELREKFVATRAIDHEVFVAYVNMVGGQDELVFDGASMVFDYSGNIIARGRQFEEELVLADLDVGGIFRARLHDPRPRKHWLQVQRDSITTPHVVISGSYQEGNEKPPSPDRPPTHPLEPLEEVYAALVTGVRDYVRKCGFKKALVGLSGGIDSSLTACVGVDALGAENIIGVAMPSRYNAPESLEDAQCLAKNLGIQLQVIPIETVFSAYLSALEEPFRGTQPNVAEENVQARIRGNFLMALANKFNHIVLTTGNKSEYATGYCTLYGDMAGGFALLKDVPKTLVYQLSRHRNQKAGYGLIPEQVLTKVPTAELRPNQKDTDTLPPYEVLDPILEAYVEQDRSLEDIVAMGFDEATVRRVIRMVDTNEYKRRQSPPGVKITPRAFGRDRRLPIVNHYKGF